MVWVLSSVVFTFFPPPTGRYIMIFVFSIIFAHLSEAVSRAYQM